MIYEFPYGNKQACKFLRYCMYKLFDEIFKKGNNSYKQMVQSKFCNDTLYASPHMAIRKHANFEGFSFKI